MSDYAQERSLSGEVCNASFRSASTLSSHVNVVQRGVKSYTCAECGAVFSKSYHLKDHSSRKHNPDRFRSFLCAQYGVQLQSREESERHAQVHGEG